MVHWIWIIVAFYLGMGFGIGLIAFLKTAKGGINYD